MEIQGQQAFKKCMSESLKMLPNELIRSLTKMNLFKRSTFQVTMIVSELDLAEDNVLFTKVEISRKT